MSTELGTLFSDIKAAFAASYPRVSVEFGRKEASKQINQGAGGGNRIVFMHGNPGGDAGDETAPRYPGQVVRPLKDELEIFTVYVWGYDGSAPSDEQKQHDAAWDLFRAWRREIFIRAEDRVLVMSKKWASPDRRERPFGAELEIQCTVRSPVYDVTDAEVATGPLHSITTVTELDQSATVTT